MDSHLEAATTRRNGSLERDITIYSFPDIMTNILVSTISLLVC